MTALVVLLVLFAQDVDTVRIQNAVNEAHRRGIEQGLSGDKLGRFVETHLRTHFRDEARLRFNVKIVQADGKLFVESFDEWDEASSSFKHRTGPKIPGSTSVTDADVLLPAENVRLRAGMEWKPEYAARTWEIKTGHPPTARQIAAQARAFGDGKTRVIHPTDHVPRYVAAGKVGRTSPGVTARKFGVSFFQRLGKYGGPAAIGLNLALAGYDAYRVATGQANVRSVAIDWGLNLALMPVDAVILGTLIGAGPLGWLGAAGYIGARVILTPHLVRLLDRAAQGLAQDPKRAVLLAGPHGWILYPTVRQGESILTWLGKGARGLGASVSAALSTGPAPKPSGKAREGFVHILERLGK